MAFMGFWGTGVEPGTQYTEKVSCTVWKMMMMMMMVMMISDRKFHKLYPRCNNTFCLVDKGYVISAVRAGVRAAVHAHVILSFYWSRLVSCLIYSDTISRAGSEVCG